MEILDMDAWYEHKLSKYFKELVPPAGKADTVAGEMVRAVCRLQYRFYNDGDMIGVGYGNETCNAAARYLVDVADSGILKFNDWSARFAESIIEIIADMWGYDNEEVYERKLNALAARVVDVIHNSYGELEQMPNETDMFSFFNKEDLEYLEYEDDEDDW